MLISHIIVMLLVRGKSVSSVHKRLQEGDGPEKETFSVYWFCIACQMATVQTVANPDECCPCSFYRANSMQMYTVNNKNKC